MMTKKQIMPLSDILALCATAERAVVNSPHGLNAYIYRAHARLQFGKQPGRQQIILRLSQEPEQTVDDGIETWDLELIREVKARRTLHDDAMEWLSATTGKPIAELID